MVVFIPFAKSHDEVVPRLACSFAHQHRSLFVFFLFFFGLHDLAIYRLLSRGFLCSRLSYTFHRPAI